MTNETTERLQRIERLKYRDTGLILLAIGYLNISNDTETVILLATLFLLAYLAMFGVRTWQQYR